MGAITDHRRMEERAGDVINHDGRAILKVVEDLCGIPQQGHGPR